MSRTYRTTSQLLGECAVIVPNKHWGEGTWTDTFRNFRPERLWNIVLSKYSAESCRKAGQSHRVRWQA